MPVHPGLLPVGYVRVPIPSPAPKSTCGKYSSRFSVIRTVAYELYMLAKAHTLDNKHFHFLDLTAWVLDC